MFRASLIFFNRRHVNINDPSGMAIGMDNVRAMAELVVIFYGVVGALLGLWIVRQGPIKPDTMLRVSALLCVVLLWPFFVLHTLRS